MSLYRQVGRRSGWLAAAFVAVLLVGFAVGFAVARATEDEPTITDAVAKVQADAEPTADALELVALHYATSREAARGQLQHAEDSFAELEPELRILAPAGAAAAGRAIARVATLVDSGAAGPAVVQAAGEARTAVRRAARLR
jgi:hypothetical protein